MLTQLVYEDQGVLCGVLQDGGRLPEFEQEGALAGHHAVTRAHPREDAVHWRQAHGGAGHKTALMTG